MEESTVLNTIAQNSICITLFYLGQIWFLLDNLMNDF